MSYREIHIDYSYKLFAKYFSPLDERSNLNAFNTDDQAQITDPPTGVITRLIVLRSQGILVEDASHNLLIPLIGWLVLPDPPAQSPAPLMTIVHGRAPSFFHPRTTRRMPERLNYQGYKYLQRHLARHGIASLSVNLGIVNDFDLHEDYLLRVQITLLHYLLLRSIAGTSLPSLTSSNSPLFILRAGQTQPTPLPDALNLSPPFSRGSPLARLNDLRSALSGRINLASIGLLGHSRGANSVLDFFQFFPPPASGTSSSSGSQPQITRRSGIAPNPHLIRTISEVVTLAGSPSQDTIKAIVPLQPNDARHPVSHRETFCLVIGSSHDEDTQEFAIKVYDPLNCPKAMLFIHGATHNRFNTVWRRIPDIVRKINRNIRCQSPIHILSNRSHQDFALHFIGGFFIATLKNEPHRLLLYTGERHAPLRLDVERAWKFGFPFNHTPLILELDNRVTQVRNLASGTDIAVTRTDLSSITMGGRFIFPQQVNVFRIEKPPQLTYQLSIPINAADNFDQFTHLSFRYAKQYDVTSRRAWQREPLRNFQISLFAGTQRIGNSIAGSAVPSLIHRAYPTRQYSHEVPPAGGCYDDTDIILQTVEVPFTQFLRGSRHTASDLNRVDRIEIRLLPARGKSTPDIFCFIDFLLTFRQIPLPP